MDYQITNTFKRKYKKKENIEQESIEKTISLLVDNPKHPGLHTHKVRGTKSIFEAYIDDEARLTFEYGTNIVIFRTNCNHHRVLKNP